MIINRLFWVKSLSVAAAGGVLLFAFQNCGKAGFDQALEQVSTGAVDALSSSAPFAFDSTYDQITYNSCFGPGLTGSKGFFTLKAGAYERGGVSVRPEFISYANTKLKPIFPATTVSVEQIKQFVVGTPENAEAQLQMALRFRGAPQTLLSPGGSTASQGTDYVNLLMDLTDDRMMEPIFRNPGSVTHYFPLGLSSTQRTLESKLVYNTSESQALGVRSSLDSDVLLSLTYTGFKDAPGRARMPANSGTTQNLAYGKGYALRFAQEIAPMTLLIAGGNAAPAATNPNNILTQIQEVNLENPAIAAAAAWVCDPDQRFTIVRRQDADNINSWGYCPLDNFDYMRSPDYRRRLAIVRRHLPADQWDVNLARHCVVPKNGSCYINNSGVEEPVQYDQRAECYQGVQGLQNQSPNRCAQFVSICLRQ